MAVTQESRKHKTPHGGVRSVIYYQDAMGQPIDKSQAVMAEVHEVNKRGEVIHRTYAEINRESR